MFVCRFLSFLFQITFFICCISCILLFIFSCSNFLCCLFCILTSADVDTFYKITQTNPLFIRIVQDPQIHLPRYMEVCVSVCGCLYVCVNEICNTNEWGGYLSKGFLSRKRDVFIHLIVFVLGRTCLHIGVVWVSVQCILFVECVCVCRFFCWFGIWLEEIGSFTPCVFCIAKNCMVWKIVAYFQAVAVS